MDVSGELVESPPTPSEPAAPTAPAPTAPASTAEPDTVPFHKHPRWIERQREIEGLRATNGQLTQTVQQLQRQMQDFQTQARGPGLTQDEQRQYLEAGDALTRIFQTHPKLKTLMDILEHAPNLLQGQETVQQLSAAQGRAQMMQGRTHIVQLAQKDGLATDPEYVSLLTRFVATAAMSIPGGSERYDQGDLSVLDEAFQMVKDKFLTPPRQAVSAATVQTKGKVKTLPPAPRGGIAGPEAPPRLERGKEREFEAGLHQRAKQMLGELLKG